MKALRISKEYGTIVNDILRQNGWLDISRNVLRDGSTIELPLIASVSQIKLNSQLPKELLKNCQVIIQQRPAFKKTVKTPFENIKNECEKRLNIKPRDLKLLPNKWELLGEVLILKIPDKFNDQKSEIAKIYAEELNAKAVLKRVDKIRCVQRIPGVELILGNETETIHLENKVIFKLDPSKVMFSSGNIDERIRISKLAEKNENVVDMFSGIGYFALPIAVHSKPKQIIACEINPIAYDYLCQNIELNNVDSIVQPILGDNREVIPEKVADRVVMGYLKSEHSHRLAALKILKSYGGMVHFHDVGFKSGIKNHAYSKLRKSINSSEFKDRFVPELINDYKIKSYGPKLVHIVLDIRLHPV